MKKILLITLLIFYSISFVPKTSSIIIDGESIASNRILSIFGPNTMYGDGVSDFFKATINTILFDFPCHYGTFMNLLSKGSGDRLILFSFTTVLPKPEIPTNGWLIGLIFGWLLRIGLLVFIIMKIRHLPFRISP